MRDSDLNPVLEQLSFKIPLQVDLTNIRGWLDALDPELACQSCGKILRLLKSLHAEKLAPDVEFEMLCKLRPVLETVASKLEKPFLDAGNPFAEMEQINAELIIFSYAELAQRFWQVAENMGAQQKREVKSQIIADALFQGMEALRRALFGISLLYDQPYEGFWRLCYRIYRRAELLNILETGVAGSAAGYDCINNSFKNLLVFYLSDTRLLTQREMKALYNMFNHRQVFAKIYTGIPEDKTDLFYRFDLEGDLPPLQVQQMGTRQGELRYVSTIKVARSVCRYLKGKNDKQDGLESGNYALFFKIAKVLGMQASRKFSRVTEKRNCPGLIGFNNVFRFLAQKNSAAPGPVAANILSGHLADISSGWVIPDLSLVPRGEEDFYRMIGSKNIAGSNQEKLQPLFEEQPVGANAAEYGAISNSRRDRKETAPFFEKIEIVDSSAKDYGVLLKAPKAPVKVGELLGMLNSQDDRFELGLVRRISSSGQQYTALGVELITLQAETAVIWQPTKTPYPQAIVFLPRIPVLQQKDGIIYPNHAVGIGETIVLQLGENKILCRVNKLLHSTAVFSLAELTVVEATSAKDR